MKSVYHEIAHIDTQVRDKLLKRARKQGMVSQDGAAAQIDGHRKHGPHKGH